MSIKQNQGFLLQSPVPTVLRDAVDTIVDLKNLNDNYYPDNYIILCNEDNTVYLYTKSNSIDATTGKCRKLVHPETPFVAFPIESNTSAVYSDGLYKWFKGYGDWDLGKTYTYKTPNGTRAPLVKRYDHKNVTSPTQESLFVTYDATYTSYLSKTIHYDCTGTRDQDYYAVFCAPHSSAGAIKFDFTTKTLSGSSTDPDWGDSTTITCMFDTNHDRVCFATLPKGFDIIASSVVGNEYTIAMKIPATYTGHLYFRTTGYFNDTNSTNGLTFMGASVLNDSVTWSFIYYNTLVDNLTTYDIVTYEQLQTVPNFGTGSSILNYSLINSEHINIIEENIGSNSKTFNWAMDRAIYCSLWDKFTYLDTSKQPTLVAGNNITITNGNVISAEESVEMANHIDNKGIHLNTITIPTGNNGTAKCFKIMSIDDCSNFSNFTLLSNHVNDMGRVSNMSIDMIGIYDDSYGHKVFEHHVLGTSQVYCNKRTHMEEEQEILDGVDVYLYTTFFQNSNIVVTLLQGQNLLTDDITFGNLGTEEWGNLQNVVSKKRDILQIDSVEGLQDKLQDKADSTELTAHTGNADIHVTAEDKAAWNDALGVQISDNETVEDKTWSSSKIASEIPTTVAELTDSADYAKTAEIAKNGTPVGCIFPFAGTNLPAGYLLCDGTSYKKTDYPDLYAVIGNKYGGDTENFKVPNLIDKFIQGSTTSGTAKDAGLPNITGETRYISDHCVWASEASGAFRGYAGNTSQQINNPALLEDKSTGYYFIFDASKSNAIYGKTNTVQPPALTMVYIIKAKYIDA